MNASLQDKLTRVSEFELFGYTLEDEELPDDEEELLWNKKLMEPGLTSPDLSITTGDAWSVGCDKGDVYKAYALRYTDEILQWRPGLKTAVSPATSQSFWGKLIHRLKDH